MKTISIPVNDRPHLLAKCLASIRACPTWREWTIVFSCEPPVKEATEQLMIATPGAHISRNSVKLGCWSNTFLACEIAHALGSTFNLYLEDDLVISPDTLRMCDAFIAEMKPGIIALRRPATSEDANQPSMIDRCKSGLFGDGFGFPRRLWIKIRAAWFDNGDGHPMWDWSVERGISWMDQWRPLIPRSTNIGLHGTHAAGAYDPNRHSPCYGGIPVSKFTFGP